MGLEAFLPLSKGTWRIKHAWFRATLTCMTRDRDERLGLLLLDASVHE
jgi:hypothetical protein